MVLPCILSLPCQHGVLYWPLGHVTVCGDKSWDNLAVIKKTIQKFPFGRGKWENDMQGIPILFEKCDAPLLPWDRNTPNPLANILPPRQRSFACVIVLRMLY